MTKDPTLATESHRAYRIWSRLSVCFTLLAIVAAGTRLVLIDTQAPPSGKNTVATLLLTFAAIFFICAVASLWVAHAVTDGWRNTLITVLSLVTKAIVVIIVLLAVTFLPGPDLQSHFSSLMHMTQATLLAAAHIGGAIVVTFALGFFLSRGMIALQATRTRHWLGEVALTLGVPVEELEDPAHFGALAQYLRAQFNNELLRNRLSDFLEQVLRVWGWFGMLLQAVLIAWVIYVTVVESASNAPYAWFILVIEVLFDAIVLAAGFLCWLLTGRDPGQAQRIRAFLRDKEKWCQGQFRAS